MKKIKLKLLRKYIMLQYSMTKVRRPCTYEKKCSALWGKIQS